MFRARRFAGMFVIGVLWLTASMSLHAATPGVLGCYVGNPNGNDANAMADFETKFDRFVAAMGQKPAYMNAFVDFSGDWPTWVSNMQWMAWSWTQTTRTTGITPVIGVPMATNSDWNDAAAVFGDIANGRHDDVWKGIVAAWRDQGFTTMYLRFGYEMDGSFMPWYCCSDAATTAAWVAAFKHMSAVVKSVSGAKVYVVWNPADMNWTAVDVATTYPGDSCVDVIATDAYSPVYPLDLYDFQKGTMDSNIATWFASTTNREHFWDYPSADQWNTGGQAGVGWGLVNAIAFAKAHNKPFALAETGAGGDGTTNGPVDDGDFPTHLAARIFGAGAPPLAFVNVWDASLGDGNWLFSDGSKPLEKAAWRNAFSTSSARPDLIVTSIGMNPASPVAGNAVTFSATVKNQGTAATPSGVILGVGFSIDGTEVSWSATDSTALAPGASVTLTANSGPSGLSTWTAAAGAHTLLANVDDVNRIPESNESNNTLSKTLSIGSGSGKNTPPEITSSPMAMPNPALADQPISFSISANDADGDALTYAWNFGDGSSASGASVSHTFVAQGQYTTTVVVADPAGLSISSTLTVIVQASVGHWKFDEVTGSLAHDSSGSNNTGTLINAPAWVAGKVNNALSLNGKNQYVTVPIASGSSLDTDASPVTIAAWINTNSLSVQQAIMQRGASNGVGSGQQGYGLFINSNGKVNVGSSGGGNFDSLATLKLQTWQHVAAVINGTASKVYINGVDQTPASVNVNVMGSALGLTIGATRNTTNTAYTRFFNGKLDDVRVYHAALSAQEIAALASGSGAALLAAAVSAEPAPETGQALTVSNIKASVSLNSPARDQCVLSGSCAGLPADFSLAAQDVALSVGGAEASFTLDPKGNARSVSGAVAFKLKSGIASFRAKLTGGLAPAWGLKGSPVGSASLTLPVMLEMGGTLYSGTVTVKVKLAK